MVPKRFSNYLLVLVFCISNQIFAQQPWFQEVPDEDAKLSHYQQAFEKHWRNRTPEKGQGYAVYKRWEWFWETRLMPDGTFPHSMINWQAWRSMATVDKTKTAAKSSSTANWTPLGPSSSPGGYSGLGRINCMAFHPTDPNTFWIGAASGGLWKTTNAGTTWTSYGDYLPVLGITDIAIDPTNPNIMYLATGDAFLGSLWTINGTARGDTKSVGVLKSTDGGLTWNLTGLNWNIMYEKLIGRLLINPSNPQILIAAASDGIWRTVNGGTSWTHVKSNLNMIDLEFKPGDPNTVYAGSRAGSTSYGRILRSLDGGATWNNGLQIGTSLRVNIAVTAADPTLVEALVVEYPNSNLKGIWRSTNSGANYTQVLDGTVAGKNYLHCSPTATGTGGQGWYDLAFTINPANSNEKWIGGVNIWKTTDGGTTWSLNTYSHAVAITGCGNNPGVPVVHADHHFFTYHPIVPGLMFSCNDGGLYKTTNGGTTWTDLSNGLQVSQLYRLSVAQSISNNVITGLQDNGTKYFMSGSWNELVGGDGMECLIDYNNPLIQYSSYANGKIYRTTNGWLTYNTISTNIPGSQSGAWVTPFVIDPVNPQILYAGYAEVYKTTDRGNTWTNISPTLAFSQKLRSLAVAPSNPNYIWAASLDQLFTTSDGGANWYTITIPPTGVAITYITLHPTDPQKVWITLGGYLTGQKIYYSNNGGASWTNVSDGLPNIPVNCIVYKTNSNNELYAGTDLGVFIKKGGTAWQPFNEGMPNVPVTELEISYAEDMLYAATYGRGLWRTELISPSYIFNGNGNWNLPSNWSNGVVAPTTIPAGTQVKIQPAAGGLCQLNGDIVVKPGGSLLVNEGKQLQVTGSVTIEDCNQYNISFGGDYSDTREYSVNATGGLTQTYGPYSTILKNWTSTGATTATALIANIYDDGWSDITANFDWTDPLNPVVNIPPQATGATYSGLPLSIRTTTTSSSYKLNTFSFCERRITLSVDLYNSSGVLEENYRIVLH